MSRTIDQRQTLYAEVTARVIAELEEGRLPWVQPWGSAACACTMPANGVTGRRCDVLPGNQAIGRLARQMETSDAARPFYPAKAIGYGSHHRGYESCRMKSFAKAFIQSSLIG